MIWDAVIRGGGPAGLSAALELSSLGWTVLLADKSRFPREKVCGGFIGPENKGFIEKHDLLKDLQSRGAQPVKEIYMSAAGGAEFKMPILLNGRKDFALGLSRREFDSVLMEKASKRGVSIRTETTVQPDSFTPEKIKLRSSQGVEEEISARYFIDASGGSVPLSHRPAGRYLGMAASFTRPHEADQQVMLHFIQGGHMGMNIFENEKLNVCYLVTQAWVDRLRGDKEALLNLFVKNNAAVRRILHGQKQVSEWKGICFSLSLKPRFFERGIFFAGDAVSAIHPVVGGGITLAISNGTMLAQILNQCAQSGESDLLTAKIYEKVWRRNFTLRMTLAAGLGWLGHQAPMANTVIHALSRKPAWARRIFGLQHPSAETAFSYA